MIASDFDSCIKNETVILADVSNVKDKLIPVTYKGKEVVGGTTFVLVYDELYKMKMTFKINSDKFESWKINKVDKPIREQAKTTKGNFSINIRRV